MRVAALGLVALLAAGCGGAAARTQGTVTPPKAYTTALAYAKCMRAHGIAHPNPKPDGDFALTPKQERELRASGTRAERKAADAVCLKEDVPPLSRAARRAAEAGPLRDLKRCLENKGYRVGKPTVKPLAHGRAFFGFEASPGRIPGPVQHACERKVQLAKRLDAIIRIDRAQGG
jgi:hypothetical protein